MEIEEAEYYRLCYIEAKGKLLEEQERRIVAEEKETTLMQKLHAANDEHALALEALREKLVFAHHADNSRNCEIIQRLQQEVQQLSNELHRQRYISQVFSEENNDLQSKLVKIRKRLKKLAPPRSPKPAKPEAACQDDPQCQSDTSESSAPAGA